MTKVIKMEYLAQAVLSTALSKRVINATLQLIKTLPAPQSVEMGSQLELNSATTIKKTATHSLAALKAVRLC